MKTSWYRYVVHRRVDDYLLLGWVPTAALEGTYHGNYSMLMFWPCACKAREPVENTDLIGNKARKFAAANAEDCE